MLKELIISFEMFDEFERLLADDIEDMEDLSIYLSSDTAYALTSIFGRHCVSGL